MPLVCLLGGKDGGEFREEDGVLPLFLQTDLALQAQELGVPITRVYLGREGESGVYAGQRVVQPVEPPLCVGDHSHEGRTDRREH